MSLTITVTAPDGTDHPFETQQQAIDYIREMDPDRTQKWILTVSGSAGPPNVWRRP
jgi:hypothetical protein